MKNQPVCPNPNCNSKEFELRVANVINSDYTEEVLCCTSCGRISSVSTKTIYEILEDIAKKLGVNLE